MEKFLLSRWAYVFVFCIWAAFIACLFSSCNSSKQLHRVSQHQDSTATHATDSISVSTSRTEEKNINEEIKEWVFGALQSRDTAGRTITNVYPTAYREIIRNTGEKKAEKKDSTRLQAKDSASQKKQQIVSDKKSKTEVLPMWSLVAIGLITGAFGYCTGRFRIIKK